VNRLRKNATHERMAAVLVLSACGGPSKALVGKWQEVNGTETIEFPKDGT
jgi:hypothetical protein